MRKLELDFAEAGVDALLVQTLPNIRYLTGFTGSNAGCLVTADGQTTLFTDPRYTVQASEEFAGGETRIITKHRMMALAAVEHLSRRRGVRIGYDPAATSVAELRQMEAKLPKGAKLVTVEGVVEKQRQVKDDTEIALIRESVKVNSAAFDATVRKIKPGLRESDIAAELEYQQRKKGASGPSFETIVASGPRTALPHAHPTDARIGPDILLLIDMGASRGGYASDMTRMLHLGRPSAKVRGWYEAVLEAQLAALDSIRAGVTAGSVDRAAREMLKAKGFGELFTHSTGHGLGLEIHEMPGIRAKDKTKLRPGMAITVEPGIYIAGEGGIRIEDTVVVTQNGCDILTPTTKEFVSL
ncbi:aminopeptidase [Bryobacterales bacterium F-183]|nr:aminopeptidase [Bryobacterales bacterium F-183]